eukprot:2338264-Pyramimonas_sp.AAC.1
MVVRVMKQYSHTALVENCFTNSAMTTMLLHKLHWHCERSRGPTASAIQCTASRRSSSRSSGRSSMSLTIIVLVMVMVAVGITLVAVASS